MAMDSKYSHKDVEPRIYKMWEEGGYFKAERDPAKKPYTIILPLPNANDPMHMGHALFTVEDVLIRHHRMLGDPTLWVPGGDHAGIETQFVYEKKLAKEGKSRFDFDRNTLYSMIKDFAEENRDLNKDQMKILGFSLDWSRYHYSMEPEIVEKVLTTFRKLHADDLVYRAKRMVNYCTKCGTAFSDLEVNHNEQEDTLYYLDYGVIQIATTRPETIFADVAVAVNPKDTRYKALVGEMATIPLIDKKIPIISDDEIKIDFGTGALKVTPAHDPVDYDIGQRHDLPVLETIDRTGRMAPSDLVPKKYHGIKVNEARRAVVEDLGPKLIKSEPLTHTISVCYRCGTTIEPMLSPQWYVRTKSLAKPAIEAVKSGKTKIVPTKRFEKMFFDWMENILDWNISRQIVWGPRIPVWYCLDCNKISPSTDITISFIDKEGKKITGVYGELESSYMYGEIHSGLQWLSAPVGSSYSLENLEFCQKCHGKHILQETDTFDTWFLSGQWPLNVLGYPDSEDFKYFYPTSVLDTLWDILFFWVARMMMFGLYLTGEVPFKVVHLHARVVDKFGQKMSKSKGNTINPLEMVEKYGADALRMALVYGVAPAADIVMSDDKVRSMRNFANKIWNMARFFLMEHEKFTREAEKELPFYSQEQQSFLTESDRKMLDDLIALIKSVDDNLTKYRFADAAEGIYHFMWDELASIYLEELKTRPDKEIALSVFRHIFMTCLKLLHPFMPFITEEIWFHLPKKSDKPLVTTSWPKI